MYEKHLNKKAKITIRTPGTSHIDAEKGVITAFNEQFIELDNKRLISCLSVVQILIEE